jgi:peptide/nickel transport system permease protein
VPRGFGRFAVGRAVQAVLFVLLVSSAALLLTHLAPGDHLSAFGADPVVVAAERHRLGLDRPFAAQYASWLGRAARLDFGESLKYRRPVATLVVERAVNTALLGGCALLLATTLGLVIGTLSGAGRGGIIITTASVVSVVLLSVPPLVTSFALLLFAATTGWLPVGGFPADTGSSLAILASHIRFLILPTLALALPLAASLERLQAAAVRAALKQPSILGARARGLSPARLVWRHALRLSLGSWLSVYAILVANVLSGSFAVEVVMSWPGLGALTYEALVGRDLFLVSGCAVAVSSILAIATLASDVALAFADPRRRDWS